MSPDVYLVSGHGQIWEGDSVISVVAYRTEAQIGVPP